VIRDRATAQQAMSQTRQCPCGATLEGRRHDAVYCRPCAHERAKACARASAKRRYQANPERAKARARAYHHANKPRLQAYKRLHHVAHAAERSGKARLRYQADPQKQIAKTREWRARNPEAAALGSKSWRKRNADSVRLYVHKRRARLRDGNSPGFTGSEWRALCESFDGRCAYCFAPGALTIDHVVPISRGGRHELSNVAPACKPCNSAKHAKLLEEWLF
jgi:5-methylcytosine-specific restriction endonuclease McrA